MTSHKAVFAAGCFWGVQDYFDQIPGVTNTTVGYTGGHTENPSYQSVCTHTTGHAEAVEVKYDPQQVEYDTLCRHYFRMHDPTQLNRQGPDVGDSYRSAIFYFDNEQKLIAEEIKNELAPKYDKPIVTDISQASIFYPAEDYHQKYTEKTGQGVCHIEYETIGK